MKVSRLKLCLVVETSRELAASTTMSNLLNELGSRPNLMERIVTGTIVLQMSCPCVTCLTYAIEKLELL